MGFNSGLKGLKDPYFKIQKSKLYCIMNPNSGSGKRAI
jgi:hypothetical protein